MTSLLCHPEEQRDEGSRKHSPTHSRGCSRDPSLYAGYITIFEIIYLLTLSLCHSERSEDELLRTRPKNLGNIK